ncbi:MULTISPECIES: signal peptidase I [Pacificimonas]|uniref:signal peptidase I n=1 Tax=Pacificimonas TaxID=1960290 RepID=UPI001CCFFC8E|nr:signal peptidase I [Pacificimonas aurantium]
MALLALAVMAIWSFLAKPFYIPSESMLPTLLTGDRLIVTKYPYGYSYLSPFLRVLPKMEGRLFGSYPEQGDIVVLKDPVLEEDWIKRVVGLPGDTVQMRGGQLWLNGEPVPKDPLPPANIVESPNLPCDRGAPAYREPQPDGTVLCQYPRFLETLPNGRQYEVLDLQDGTAGDFTQPVTVPDGYVFLMGDNRDRSADSRFAARAHGGLGLLPVENISGRAEFITFSVDGSTELLNPATWWPAFRTERAWDSLRSLPDHVREEIE